MELREAFILAVVSASVVTAGITGVFRLLSEKWQRAFELKKREADHAGRLTDLALEQHLRARDEHLPMLLAVTAFVAQQHRTVAEERVGFIVAYHPDQDERVSTWPEAMAELRRIALLHPTAEVRHRAAAVQHSIQNQWVDPADDEPDLASFREWMDELRAITELMHSPPERLG